MYLPKQHQLSNIANKEAGKTPSKYIGIVTAVSVVTTVLGAEVNPFAPFSFCNCGER